MDAILTDPRFERRADCDENDEPQLLRNCVTSCTSHATCGGFAAARRNERNSPFSLDT